MLIFCIMMLLQEGQPKPVMLVEAGNRGNASVVQREKSDTDTIVLLGGGGVVWSGGLFCSFRRTQKLFLIM